MAERKIWSAAELELVSPSERHSAVRARFEADLAAVSPGLLERHRRMIAAHVAANEGTYPAQPQVDAHHRDCLATR